MVDLFEASAFDAAKPVLEVDAKQGDVVAKALLANLYFYGLGSTPKDRSKARTLLRESARGSALEERARGGNAHAQSALGEWLLEEDVDRKREAVAWFRRAANGSVEGQYWLGLCLLEGIGTTVEEVEAVSWLKKAAERGHQGAQHKLGLCYKRGRGVAGPDEEEALRWLSEAAAQGHSGASKGLVYERAVKLYNQKRYAEAFPLLVEAGETQGHPVALALMGTMLYYGQGCEKNGARYKELFIRSSTKLEAFARRGDAHAQAALGECLAYGYGVAKNEHRAFQFFLMAAEQNHAEAQYWVGISLLRGSGTDRDPQRAITFFRRAAANGHPSGQNKLAECLLSGEGVVKNEAEAREWFEKAASQGHSGARSSLIKLDRRKGKMMMKKKKKKTEQEDEEEGGGGRDDDDEDEDDDEEDEEEDDDEDLMGLMF